MKNVIFLSFAMLVAFLFVPITAMEPGMWGQPRVISNRSEKPIELPLGIVNSSGGKIKVFWVGDGESESAVLMPGGNHSFSSKGKKIDYVFWHVYEALGLDTVSDKYCIDMQSEPTMSHGEIIVIAKFGKYLCDAKKGFIKSGQAREF